MSLSIGIVGLPNSGKTTLFNALTAAGGQVAPYPFTTIEPNVGVVSVADERLEKVAALVHPQKVVPTTIEFLDIAGLIKGASTGEGLGNQFLGHIRNVDAICLVLRCFQAADIPHVHSEIDPRVDKEVLDLELALADLSTVEKRSEKLHGLAKGGPGEFQEELILLQGMEKSLGQGHPVRKLNLSQEELDFLRPLNLLTAKPCIYVANVGEEDLPDGGILGELVREIGNQEQAEVVVLCAKLEAELLAWPGGEAQAYRQALGLAATGREALILAGYRLLSLISFFTIVGGREARAWAVERGTTAPQAAGQVHSDMEQGFIRAEVISWSQLLAYGSLATAREAGAIQSVGRDYQVQDGDVIQFRFQV